MKTILITGAGGFLGRNLAAHLKHRPDVALIAIHRETSEADLKDGLARADVVFHLAGVNRPEKPDEFDTGNAGYTDTIVRLLRWQGRRPKVIVSSSIQAAADNPYGLSKRRSEEILAAFARETGTDVALFRLKNIFGKWSRPNYNSVVATFCHNLAHDQPIQVNDPDRPVELVFVDDVVAAFVKEMDEPGAREGALVAPDPIPSHTISLGDLADRIRSFHAMQPTLRVPDFSLRFNQQLYATYLSYVDPARWEYGLEIRSDNRGNLAEFIKSPWFGQVFISRTHPGITRGNHFHHTKTEKFLVIAGEGLIKFRHVEGDEVIERRVRGEDYRVVEIPPGYTHSITNVGSTEMITLFWASEIFDPERPDTFFVSVDQRGAS